MNFLWFQLISNDISNCEINCFQKQKRIFEFFFVDLLTSRIKDRSHIFSDEV